MFSVLRRRLSYANVVATLALLFAMSGGALAASKFLITSTKQIKPSVLAQLKAKSGKNGAAGAQGPAGPAGPVGPQGAQGVAGANGKDGASGSNGVGATTVSFGGEQHGCKEGGLEVKSASAPTFVCNGSPWTAGGTLPKGATETGTWSISHIEPATDVSLFGSISFPIQLASGGKAFYINEKESASKKGEVVEESGCTGDASEPTAPEGTLCVYANIESPSKVERGPVAENTTLEEGKYGKSGAIVEVELGEAGGEWVEGGWAVKAS